MNRKICIALLWLLVAHYCNAQQFYLPKSDPTDSAAVTNQISLLTSEVLPSYSNHGDQKDYLQNLFRLQIIAKKYTDALATISLLRDMSKADDPRYADLQYIQHQLFAQAKIRQAASGESFDLVFSNLFRNLFTHLDNKRSLHSSTAFLSANGIDDLKTSFRRSLAAAQQKDSIGINEAIDLCSDYYQCQLYQNIESIATPLIKEDDNRRYIIEQVLVKTKDGAHISAVVARQRGVTTPLPVALMYTIYADSTDRIRIIEPAIYGYVAVMAYTRGKALSPDEIVPYEDDGKDANEFITWVSRQSWCNGKVGMYSGSYNGFTQWAAAKYANPALKTIVPYVAAIPGFGLPMENNVFINANYGWVFFVTDNKYLDDKVYSDPDRWQKLNENWYASGRPYRKIDSIDGTPNPLLQRWLKHPDYDKYWQDQVPYKNDFARINIPVLTITGYYDDGQISALRYLTEHLKYNPKANHYLIIGPYDHFGAQRGGVPILRDYPVDPVALISTMDITFQWFDYILKGGKKPAILQDKINYEVMGANVWRHAPSLGKMANKTLKLYLTNIKSDSTYKLSAQRPVKPGMLTQEINLADRKTYNNDYYPYPIIKKQLDHSDGLFFISEPLGNAVSVEGIFSGELKATINKKDMDIGIVLYEVMPNGEYFQLSYFLGRASYARDMSVRKLLHPGVMETIPFSRARLVSRQLSKGSRLLVVLNINKNSNAQVNYGTGKDVSDETIDDAKGSLKIQWSNRSFINVPVYEGMRP